MTPNFDFDLWHEDGLLTDDQPELFVDLSVEPVVFTVRGIAYFAPRLRLLGFDISRITTALEFRQAKAAWDRYEFALLREKVASAAAKPGKLNPQAGLQAAMDLDEERFAEVVAALEHRKRAGLRVVPTAHGPGAEK